MFTWAEVILAFLKITNLLLEEGQKRKWVNEGEAIQIAKAQAETLRKSQYAKDALAEFTGRSDADIDDFLRNLEPRPADGK